MSNARGIRAGRAFVEVGANDQPFNAALARVHARLQAFSRSLAAVGGGLLAAGSGVLATLAWPVQLAANLEQAQASFEVLLGDAEKAKALLQELNQFAASTPFQLSELNDAARMLLAFRSEGSNVTSELRMLGDVSSAIGAPLGEIAEIYGKARVQGRLFMEDINQLTGRGIPIIGALAAQFGVAESKVRDLVSGGKVNFSHLQAAMQAMTATGGQFAGMMEKQSETLIGMWSTLKDNIGAAVRPLGQALLPILSDLLPQLTTGAQVLGEFLEQNKDLAVYAAAGGVALVTLGGAIAAVAGSLAVGGLAIGGIATAWATFAGLVSATAAALVAVVGAVFSPFGAGIAAVVAGAYLIAQAFGGVRESMAAMRELLAPVSDEVGAVADGIGEGFTAAGATALQAWQAIRDAVASGDMAAAAAIGTSAMEVAWLQVTSSMADIWAETTNGFRDGWTDVSTYLAQAGGVAFYGLLGIWESVTTSMQSAFATATTYIIGTLDWIGTKLQQLGALWQALWSDEGQANATNQLIALQEAFDARAAERGSGNTGANSAREQQSQARLEELRRQAGEYVATLDDMAKQEKEARRSAQGNALDAARERLAAAKNEFSTAVDAANEARNKSAEEVRKKAAEAKEAGTGAKSSGTFNIASLAQSLGILSDRDRMTKATERTAAATEIIADAADQGGLLFG